MRGPGVIADEGQGQRKQHAQNVHEGRSDARERFCKACPLGRSMSHSKSQQPMKVPIKAAAAKIY
jgi:hypothetical protein